MPSRVTRVVTTAALLGALAWSPGIGWAENTVLVPPAPAVPVPPQATETMIVVYDPLSFEQLVEIRALLAQLVGAVQKPSPPSSLPTPMPPAEVAPKK